MLDLLKDEQSPPVNVPVPSGGPLIPATGLMIGSSAAKRSGYGQGSSTQPSSILANATFLLVEFSMSDGSITR
jgi:hypothetical protein